MSSLMKTLGLEASSDTPSYGANYLIFHFVFAYAVLSSRVWKMRYKIDHQVSPRQDLIKYGAQAVQTGKITQAQLNQIIRVESCHANSVEHFPVFAAGIVLAHVAGVPNHLINLSGLSYTIARVFYSISYIFVTDATMAYSRGIFWWASNIICIRLLWKGGVAFNAKA